MFYLWLFTSVVFLISIFGQVLYIANGIIPNLGNLALTLAMEVTTVCLAYRKLKEPHESSYYLLSFGFWLVIISFFIFINKSNYLSPISLVGGIELGLLVLSCGLTIIYYNKGALGLKKNEESVPLLPEKEDDNKIFEVVYDLERVLQLNRVNNDPEVLYDLLSIEEFLTVLEQKEYKINNVILEQISEIFCNYYGLCQQPIASEKIEETLKRIELLFGEIREALRTLYEDSCSITLVEANINAQVLSQQLKSSGLLDSDFKK